MIIISHLGEDVIPYSRELNLKRAISYYMGYFIVNEIYSSDVINTFDKGQGGWFDVRN